MISFPLASKARVILNVANIDAMASHELFEARN